MQIEKIENNKTYLWPDLRIGDVIVISLHGEVKHLLRCYQGFVNIEDPGETWIYPSNYPPSLGPANIEKVYQIKKIVLEEK